MLFYFPAEIELTDLRDALERYASFLDESPLESASSIQISMLGWKGYDRYPANRSWRGPMLRFPFGS